MAKVAFLGLGVMGFPMAGHLAAKGHEVAVYNRSAEKAARWVDSHGGRAAATATTAGAGSPVFSFFETVGSIVTAVLAVLIPIVAVIFVVVLLGIAGWILMAARRWRRARAKPV